MKRKLLLVALLTLGLASCNEVNPNNSISTNEQATTQMQLWTVTLDLNYEGGGVYKTFTVEAKTSGTNIQTQLEAAKPTREGYTFDSWYHDTYTKVEWIYSRDKVLADTTLYAGWNAVEPGKPVEPDITTSTPEPSTSVAEPTTTVEPDTTTVTPEPTPGTTTTVPEPTTSVVEPTTTIVSTTVSTNTTTIIPEISTPVEKNMDVVFNFTLPSWDPIAENPKIYYWGTDASGAHMQNTVNWDDCSDQGGAMTKIEGNDYMYKATLNEDESITGVIVMFYQAGVRKQSVDMTTYTITEGGIYNITFVGAPWEGDKFTATIAQAN